jgi:membrane associated rhomboid family serine protease
VKGGGQRVHRGVPAFDPIVTKVLIGLNLLAYLWSTVQGGSPTQLSPDAQRLGALFATDVDTQAQKLIGVTEGEWYRLITSGFLHHGLIHIGFNMYALWILGPQLERVLGRPRFVTLYFAAMLGGSAGVMLLDPDIATVGASGAVFGLFGAVAVVQRAAGLNIFLTFAISSISVGGHVGGLIAGALIGWVDVSLVRARQPEWVGAVVTGVFALVLAAAAIALASNPVL